MAQLEREAAEAAIGRVLLAHWDRVADGAAEQPPAYGAVAHDVYSLLARGASDLQVERHLRSIERDALHRPELGERDLTPVLRSLRDVERSM